MTNTRYDVVFADAGNRPLTLDIYRPSGTGNGAAALMLHGGAWARGSKAMLAPHAAALAAQGFVAIVSEYRLVGEARFPAQIHDVMRALRWVRGHAGELGFDPDKLCLEGHSAGGHLALLAAGSGDDARLDPPEGAGGVSAAVAAVAAIYPPVLFYVGGERPAGGVPAAALPGAEISAEMAALASPLHHIGPGLPPVMLLHGDADRIVPVDTSRTYEARVREAGGKVDLHLFAGFPHGFANHPKVVPQVMAMIGDFFRRTVVEPDAYVFGPSRFELAAAQG
ncbi:MAG: alpha/beta hydrolase [Rhizomicrobium sp.]